MKKTLCFGEVASHNWAEIMVKEGYITHRFNSCPSAFDTSRTYNFSSSHRIYDKKHILFLMVLFDEIITSSIVNFPLDKIEDAGLIAKDKFHLFERVENYKEFYENDIDRFYEVTLDFMAKNKKSLIKYLSKDILHTSHYEVDAEIDYKTFFDNPLGEGVLSKFNPNVFLLRQIRDALASGLKISEYESACFYNGRLSYVKKNDKHTGKYNDMNIADNVRYILQLDLTPQINEFPIPQNINDVLYLRKQPSIISFREIFFNWLDCLQKGDYDVANKIKNDVIKANSYLDKYNNWEKKKTNMFYCTLDVIVGLIPYLSSIVGIISPYILRKTLKDKQKNSWVNLLR